MNWRRWIAAILTPVMVVCLSGFSFSRQNREAVQRTGEEMLALALKKLENAESMHTSLTMDMDIKVFRFKTGIEASMDMVSFRSPKKVSSEISLDMGILGSAGVKAYGVEEDGVCRLYVQNGRKWKTQKITQSQLCRYDGLQLMKVYLQQIKDLEKTGTESVNGRKAYKYTGVVENDGLQKLLLDTGSLQILSGLFENTILKPVGTFLKQETEVKSLLKKAQAMEITVWIDAYTGYPLQCRMDLTEMMSDAYKMMRPGIASAGKETERDIWSEIEVIKTDILIQCDDFDKAEDFQVPSL